MKKDRIEAAKSFETVFVRRAALQSAATLSLEGEAEGTNAAEAGTMSATRNGN
jgi:hypothetical protein